MHDFTRRSMSEVLSRFMAANPAADLDALGLFSDVRRARIGLEDGFYLLPIDWEYDGDEEVGAFVEKHGLRHAFHGSQLVDVISVARDQRPDVSADDVLTAYNHYLEYDAFLDWS